jgi:hypothetical protein
VLRGLLDRIVLLVGTIAGGCVPGFIQQYRQRVGGRLDQVQVDLAPFQEIARRYHDGDMDKLVRHHLASTDPTFHAEGQALQSMMLSLSRLQSMVEGLSGSIWQQIGYLLRRYDGAIGAATWRDHVPTFSLEPGSVVVALTVGVSCWLVFHLLWKAGSGLGQLAGARRASRAQGPVRRLP